MSDVKCPYCDCYQEINHDDGYGYSESEDFEQECEDCGKEFKFTTEIMFSHNVFCQDGDHEIEVRESKNGGNTYTHEFCEKCDWSSCKIL